MVRTRILAKRKLQRISLINILIFAKILEIRRINYTFMYIYIHLFIDTHVLNYCLIFFRFRICFNEKSITLIQKFSIQLKIIFVKVLNLHDTIFGNPTLIILLHIYAHLFIDTHVL